VSRLAVLERSGLVRRGYGGPEAGLERALPVVPELRGVLPIGLSRGGTVAVSAVGTASHSLVLLMLAAVSQAGLWCAVLGMPDLSPVAAHEAGLALERLDLRGFRISGALPYANPQHGGRFGRDVGQVRAQPLCAWVGVW
jgi:hypothetical protein